MAKRRRAKRWGMPEDRKEPWTAKAALILLLLNAFLWAGLRNMDIVVLSLAATLISLAGMLLALRARHKVRRHGGRIAGEALATIAYWGNLIVFLLSLMLFSYSMVMGILRGDFL